MSRPSHLTRGDIKFLAGVSRDPVAAVNAVEELVNEVLEAAAVAGVEPDLSIIEDLEGQVDDPNRLDEIRAGLRSMLGRIERGELKEDPGIEQPPTEEITESHE